MTEPALVKALQTTLLPLVEFNGVSLRQAVEHLRIESFLMECAAAECGLSVVLLVPTYQVDAPLVTFRRENLSILDALRYVAGTAGLCVLVCSTGVLLGNESLLHQIKSVEDAEPHIPGLPLPTEPTVTIHLPQSRMLYPYHGPFLDGLN